MIDTHCHLADEKIFGQLERVLGNARNARVDRIVTCGSDLESSKVGIEIAKRNADVWATVGVHPEKLAEGEIDLLKVEKELILMAGERKVIAIGECGLDSKIEKEMQIEMRKQLELFELQAQIAAKLDLPLIVHNRGTDKEILDVLNKVGERLRVILHCFSSEREFLRKAMDKGYMVSFSGNITYKKNEELRECVKNTREEQILVETDAPYLSPEPMRGTVNEPSRVRLTLEMMSIIRQADKKELESKIAENALRVFNKMK